MSTAHRMDLRARTILLIEAVTSATRRFKELETLTRVPSATWRSFWNRDGALPSGTMLEEIGREWPQFAFWLITGLDDWQNGHVAPATATYLPERARAESAPTSAYFVARMKTENRRPATASWDQMLEPLTDLRTIDKAMEMLGGTEGLDAVRQTLKEQGVIDPSPAGTETWPLEDGKIIKRATEAAARHLDQQHARGISDLKSARDRDIALRRAD